MREPTGVQCTNRAAVALDDGSVAYACWYPQMGGYAAKALVIPGGCAEVFVWHDGDFPFLGSDVDPVHGRKPTRLHHCDGEQFVDFGQFLMSVCEEGQ